MFGSVVDNAAAARDGQTAPRNDDGSIAARRNNQV
jgi:hypothetical protein